MSKELPTVDELSYEQAFSELEALIATLEEDDSSLDSMLAKFERGQELARHCASLLESAELKVKQLSGDEITDFKTGK